ncbi:MAG: ATP-dependent zinc metalloprotease FtsH [Tidjanibacter sp.]|nr:ATP-dependent zinc metalloprotease FtsH [Tidjanibacter sp.]
MAENNNNNKQNNRPNNMNRGPQKQPMPPMRPLKGLWWIYSILFVIIIVWGLLGENTAPMKTNWNTVEQMIADGDVERIEIINKEMAEVYLTKEAIEKYKEQTKYKNIPDMGMQFTFNIGSVDTFREDLDKTLAEYNMEVPLTYENRRSFWSEFFTNYFPFILMILFIVIMMRSVSRSANGGAGGQGGIFNVGKSKAQMFDKNNENAVTFKDVAGLEEAKVEIMEIVDFLRKPQKYRDLGGKIPKGALLVGPPGTGKTLLAKAVAGEANVPFFSISGSDFVEMFVGVGASRVRDLFQKAKEKAPCIVFIDEVDAIGRARGKNAGFSGNDERENTLNQLLTEMDGFGTNSGVIILAATNRADILDKALMRAGRFDRQIEVALPDVKDREQIFGVHLKRLKLASDIDREFLAKQTAGFSGADIANVCNEAALIAARHNKKAVEKVDFISAIDRIVGGLEKRHNLMSKEDKRKTAYHEIGHALVWWLDELADPIVKVTIIPRGRSLGATWTLPEDRVSYNRTEFINQIAGLVAGRVAEEVTFGEIATGALSDLERATKIAYSMVAYYGMSDKVGHLSYYDSTGQSEYAFTKPFSEQTAVLIDSEVKQIVDDGYAIARKVILEHQDKMDELVELLLKKETIFSEDLERILGKAAREKRKERIEFEENRPTGDISSDLNYEKKKQDKINNCQKNDSGQETVAESTTKTTESETLSSDNA